MDSFEDIAGVKPGTEVKVETEAGAAAGVVLAINPEARVLTFTDGRTVVFPAKEDEP